MNDGPGFPCGEIEPVPFKTRDGEDEMMRKEALEYVSADWPDAREHADRCAVRRRAIRPHLHRRLQRGRRA